MASAFARCICLYGSALSCSRFDIHQVQVKIVNLFSLRAQALQEASERLDASAAHSQEKLTNALEIAASLRQMLDEKDRHVAALEAERQAGELDLGEMQRKVAAANQTLRDAVDARESRIRELEAQARQYQQEVGMRPKWKCAPSGNGLEFCSR